jgi:hypothetical protein
MDDSHGKEIDLQKTTIKIPGANKPRIGKSVVNLDTNKLNNDINSLHLNNEINIKTGLPFNDESNGQTQQGKYSILKFLKKQL